MLVCLLLVAFLITFGTWLLVVWLFGLLWLGLLVAVALGFWVCWVVGWLCGFCLGL